MSLNPIQFVLSNGGIGTPIPGADFISGMLHYTATAPSGFVLGQAQPIFGVSQAESLGILSNYNDETAATGTITVTYGATGDTVTVIVNEPGINGTTNIVNLGTYTVLSTDTTSAILAASIEAFINNGTPQSGYSATATTDVITLKARAGMGIALNAGTNLVVTETGTTTTVITQFTGGVASKQAVWHYQISEYFRMQPSGKLWVGFFTVPSTYTFAELETIQNQSNGEIRQFGVYSAHGTSASTVNADLDAIQIVGESLFAQYQPAQVIYAPNLFSVTNLSTLSNLGLRDDNYVSCVIAQDGGGLGAFLSLTHGSSIPAYGACLGTVSLAKVENDIAWQGAFNVSNGTEDAVPAFSNGQLYSSFTFNQLVSIDSYRYIFFNLAKGSTGTYWNDSHCACLITSNYAYIERNRVIQKAQRIIYTSFSPLSNSDLLRNSDGTLAQPTINIFKNALAPSMNQMVANGEISAFATDIDPTQNVLSTSKIVINVNIVGVGIARNIVVNLGFSLSV